MNFEQPKNFKNKEALDDQWFARFKDCGSFEEYEYLNGEREYREKQKQKFLSGEIESPKLDYPDLDKLDISQKESVLLQLKKDILEQEPNELVKQIYRWKINQKIAEIRMLGETKKGNNRRFLRYSEFIYGKPEREIFDYTMNQIRKVIKEKESSPNENVRGTAQSLMEKLGNVFQDGRSAISELKDFIINNSKSVEIKEKEDYMAEEIKKVFEQALEKYQIEGWTVIVSDKVTNINVSQENKNVNIPQSRKMKEKELMALIKHEIGTHVLRRENGERSKLRLLGLGLDRYLKGEEGVATYQQQSIEGSEEFAGLDRHLSISLALGMDGKKRNFKDVFEILKDYYFINSKKEEKEALVAAQNSAWNTCVRTFRGTSCDFQGACLTKDIVYREGNIGVWDVVKNKPEEVKRFMVGKYDPSNPRHIWILEQLGINDEDLEELNR